MKHQLTFPGDKRRFWQKHHVIVLIARNITIAPTIYQSEIWALLPKESDELHAPATMLEVLEDTTSFDSAASPTFAGEKRHFGNAVLSRYRIKDARGINLSVRKYELRNALDADIDCHGHPLRILAIHLGLRVGKCCGGLRRVSSRCRRWPPFHHAGRCFRSTASGSDRGIGWCM